MFMRRISLCENIHLGFGIFNFDNDIDGVLPIYSTSWTTTPPRRKKAKYPYGD